jgi:GAF domain-containing protein
VPISAWYHAAATGPAGARYPRRHPLSSAGLTSFINPALTAVSERSVDDLDRLSPDAEALEQARQTIRRQAAEIDRLRREVAGARALETLRHAVEVAATAGTIAAPVSHARLLQLIVETAASVIDAEAGALFLVDEAAGELVFEVAIGPKADEVKHLRVPLGHGIAGLVALTGQPMAVSDAGQDPRQAADIAQSVSYVPESLLCVPLFVDDRITGVFELLNKRGGRTFGSSDLTVLGLFARQAGVAIELSRTRTGLATVVLDALRQEPAGDSQRNPTEEELIESAAALDEVGSLRGALDAARLVREISEYGENERAACRSLLQGFADYLRRRPETGSGARAER